MNHQAFSILKRIKSFMHGLAKRENLKIRQEKNLLCIQNHCSHTNIVKLKILNKKQKVILIMYVETFDNFLIYINNIYHLENRLIRIKLK